MLSLYIFKLFHSSRILPVCFCQEVLEILYFLTHIFDSTSPWPIGKKNNCSSSHWVGTLGWEFADSILPWIPNSRIAPLKTSQTWRESCSSCIWRLQMLPFPVTSSNFHQNRKSLEKGSRYLVFGCAQPLWAQNNSKRYSSSKAPVMFGVPVSLKTADFIICGGRGGSRTEPLQITGSHL